MAKLKDGTRIYGNANVDSTLTTLDLVVTGNITIQGTTTTVDSTVTTIQDPVITLGTGGTNDGLDRGVVLQYNDGADKTGFMGWDAATGEFAFADTTAFNPATNSITIDTYGNVRGLHFIGEGDTLGNITGANVTGTVQNANMSAFAGNVTGASQGNITSLGTLTTLKVGNLTDNTQFGNGTITATGLANVNTLSTVGDANIGGDLNVTGNLTGRFTGTIGAKGSDTQVQFNDGGTQNATSGFTFNKSNNSVTATGTITGGNLVTSGTANVTGTATVGNLSTAGSVTADGDITYSGYLTGYGEANIQANIFGLNLNTTGLVAATGNVTGGNLVTSNGVFGNTATFTGNASAGNISTAGSIVATGRITGASLETGGGANVVGTATVGNLVSVGTANVTGNITGANLVTAGLVSATGNVIGGNLVTTGTANIGNLTISGTVNGDLIPATNEGGNLGSETNAWKDLWLSGNSIKLGTQTISSNAGGINVSNSLSVTTLDVSGNANVGNLNSSGAVVGANVTSNALVATRVTFAGTGGLLSDDAGLTYASSTLTAANVTSSGNVIAASVTSNALTSTRVTFAGTGGVLTDNSALTFTTSTGELSATLLKGTLSTASQPNVTSVGILTSLEVSGQSNVANIHVSSNANIVGNTTVGGLLDVTGNVSAGNISTTGSASVGTLTAGDTTVNGNLTVTGTTTSVNTTVSQLSDPLFDLGNGANGAPLTSDDGMDRGLVMHTFSMGGAVDVFMGYKDDADEFVLAKNVTVVDNVVQYGITDSEKQANLADLRLGNIHAYNANFGGVVFSEGNISLGAGSYLNGNLNGNVSGNFTVSGGAGAIQFADASNTLTSSANLNFNDATDTLTIGVSGAGNVVANLVTGTLTTNAQPNITSVGTLTSLDVSTDATVTGNVSAGNIKTDNLLYANGVAWDLQQAAGSNTQIQFNDGSNNFTASANLTFNNATQVLAVTGKVTAANVTVSALSNSYLTMAGTDGALKDSSFAINGFGQLVGANIVLTSEVDAHGVYDKTLTTGRVVFSGAQGRLIDDAELTYDSATNTVTANNVTATEKVSAANVAASTLTAGRVTFAGAAGLLVDNSALTYDGSTNLLSVTGGNVSANYINGAYITGDGGALSNLTAGNITGQVANALVAGTVYGNAQTNITSLGELTGLTVRGITDLANASNVKITGGTSGQYLQTNGSGDLSWASVDTSQITNGTSNVSIPTADGNILMVRGGTTVLTVTGLGANITGYIDVTGNINGNNISAASSITVTDGADSTSATTGAITVAGGIGATGNIYTGHSVGFANNNGGTASAAYIQFNATANSLDFIFN